MRDFVIRNSKNGYLTKLSTISEKFGITEDEALVIAGFLLNDNTLECARSRDGQMKLYEAGHLSEIRRAQKKRFAQQKADAPSQKGGQHETRKQKPRQCGAGSQERRGRDRRQNARSMS